MDPVMFPPMNVNIPPAAPVSAPVIPALPVAAASGVTLDLNILNGATGSAYTDKGVTVGDSRRIQMEKSRMKQESEPCRACAERTYQDGSNDMGVSFQTPTNVSPEAAGSLVRAHEQEHVSREGAKARENGLRAMSTVRIHTNICPECRKIYVSGGTTTTQFTADPEKVIDAYAKQMGKTTAMLMGA